MRWLVLLVACGAPELAPPDAPAVHAWVDDVTDGGGVLTVQLQVPQGASYAVEPPEVEGLTFHPRRDPRAERVGDDDVVTWQWRFGGYQGTYEIPAVRVEWSQGETAAVLESEPIWVDLGVPPVRPGEIADIGEPPRIWRPSAGLLAAAGGLVLLLAVSAAVAVGLGRRPAPPAPVEPPGDRALRLWGAARRDPALDDHGRALAISQIFREYLEEVLRFGATAATTSEIMAHLGGLPGLPEGNLPRAKRLLRATDRIKFADASATTDLFDELDADLRGFVESTRPRVWQGDP